MATTLQKFRRRHPEFSELSDFEIANGLREKFARESDEPVLIRPFFEAIGGPELQTELEPTGEPPPAAPPPPPVPREDAPPPLAAVPAIPSEPPPPAPPATAGLTGLELPGEPGTPAAQLTGENLQAGIEGGQALEAIARFARGGDQPDERIARRQFRQKEAVAERTRELLGDAQKETDKEAKDRRQAFAESAFGPDTPLGQIVGVTMNLIPMTLGLFAATHTNDPEILKTVVESFGPFDQDPREAGKRRVRSIASGAVAAGGGIIGFLGNKTNIEALQSGALNAQGIAEGLMPRDPAFIEELGAGFGSTAVFWVPGVGIAKGVDAIAKTSHVAALWAGAGASGVMEAMAEAGNTFQSLVDQGIKPEEAERRADEVFLENATVVTLFNRFGLFGEQASQFARITLTAAAEGVQEFFQAVIGNLAETDPLLQGAGKSTLIGALVGGGVATATPGGVLPGERPTPPGAPPPPTAEEQAAIDADVPTPPTAGPLGEGTKTRTAFTPRGDAIETEFAVVEGGELITSNDDAGNINPAFPAELQPRDRSKDASQVQITKIAGSLNPALLGESQTVTDGAPITGEDLVVESGNARVLAIIRALTAGGEPGRAYRAFITENAAQFGITPAEIEGLENPVLIRIRRTDVDRAEFTRQANESAGLELTPAEAARKDAARLTDDDLTLFNPDQSGDPLALSNQPFINRFLQALGPEEAAKFIDDQGKGTKQLRERINSAIFARVYGDDRLIALQAEAADPAIRNILTALQVAAPAFAKAKAIDENLGGLNVPEKITDAVQLIRDVQARGGTLEQLLEQGNLFGEADAETLGFARFIAANNRSAERMGRAFSTIAEFLQTEVARQQTGDIFGDAGASLPELLAAANREIEKRNAEETKATGGTQGDIFGANPPRVSPAPGVEPPPGAGDRGGQPTGQPGAPAPGATAAPTAAAPGPTQEARGTRTQGGEQVIQVNALELRVLDKAFDELELHETVIDSVSIEVETTDDAQTDALAVAGEVIAPPDEATRAELREGLNDIADAIRAGELAPDFAATDVAAAKAMEDLAADIAQGAAEEVVEEQPELTETEIDNALEKLASIQEGRIDEIKREIGRNAKATELAAIVTQGSPGGSFNRAETEGSATVLASGKDVIIRFGPEQSLRLTPGKVGARLLAIFGAQPQAPAPPTTPAADAGTIDIAPGATMDLSGIKKSRIKPASKARPGLVWVRFGDGIFARRVLAEPDPDTNVHRSTGFVIEHAGHPTAVTPFTLLTASGERVVSESGRGWATLPPVEKKALALFEQAKAREEEEAEPAIPDAQDPDFRAQAILEQLVFDQFNNRKTELAALIKAAASSDTDAELGALVQQLTGDGDTAGFQFSGPADNLGLAFRRAFAHRIETARPGLGAGLLGETREELEADLAASRRIFETLGHVRAANLSRDEGTVFVNTREALTRRIKDIERKLKKLAPATTPTADATEGRAQVQADQDERDAAKARHDAAKDAAAPEPRAVTAADKKSIAALRKSADGLQKQIDEKMNPATAGQNMTPKRARTLDSMQSEGRRLEKIQTTLRAIADSLQAGTLPDVLLGIKGRPTIEMLRRDKFPTPRLRASDANDLTEAFKGLGGIGTARTIVGRLRLTEELELGPRDADLVRRALAAAKKAGRKDPLAFSFTKEQLADNARAVKAGITNQAEWDAARAAINALEATAPAADPIAEARQLFDKLKRDLVGAKGIGIDFFPTPPEVAADLVERADAQAETGPAGAGPGDSVLEPSAGSGNIIEAMAEMYEGFPEITVTALEQSTGLVEVLRAQADALTDKHAINVQQGDFLEYKTKHDIIVMNPPFSKNRDIDHVLHAWSLLKPGGRIIAVMSEHAFIAGGKKETAFREFLEENGGTSEELDTGELADKRITQRSNVKGRIVELNRPREDAAEGTVAEERGTSYMIREPADSETTEEQLDLFAPEGKPAPPAKKPTAIKTAVKTPKQRVRQVRTGVVHSGFDVVNTPEEAAHVVAPFRKEAQESFIALVLGEGNRVLRVIRHSIGTTSGATADVGIAAGAVAETPGAKTVYFAHNHPSGVPVQSSADRAITEAIAQALHKSGIKMLGGIVVAPGAPVATLIPVNPRGEAQGETRIVIKAAPRRIAIPVTERRIRTVARGLRGTLGSPSEARVFMQRQPRSGVLLMDNRHNPLKFVEMTTQEMRKLRTGEVGTGANRLQQEIVGQNAAAIMVKSVVAEEGSLEAITNVGTFAAQHRVRMLDGFLLEADGSLTSLSERGMAMERTGGIFMMADVPPGADLEVDVEERGLEGVRQIIIRAGGSVIVTDDIDGDLRLDLVELPANQQGKGIGSRFMAALAQHADTFGRDIELVPGAAADFEGKTRPALVKFYKRFGFTEDVGGLVMFRTTTTAPAPSRADAGGVGTQKVEPGPGRVPLLRDRDLPVDTTGAPKKAASGFGVFKTPIAPDRPLRRERILRNIERDFGVRIYQGRIKRNQNALGFYRGHIEELRLKDNNAIEVLAHEIAHFIDDIDPRFKEAYNDPLYINDILKIASEVNKANEGFAEFVRLFLTQEERAVAEAPGFYDKFIELIEGSRFETGLVRAQADMHAWFRQGATNRALSKIGRDTSLSGRVQDVWEAMRDFADSPADAAIASSLDRLQGVKIFERTVTGTIGDADLSPYKIMRLVAGIRGVVRAVFRNGTIGYAANGDVVFTGDGLEQVFKPIADVMDEAMAYFAGKRAAELRRQDRENLFSPSEIKALIDQGKDNPRIVQAFKDYRAFNGRMMDFYQASGLLSAESRAIIEELNKSYVPFHRILELADGTIKPGAGARAQFKRLRGGTANVDDIYGNIMQSVAALVDAAVKNKAKQRVYALVQRGQGAAQFAARIPRETQAVQLDSKQVASKVKGILADMGLELDEIFPDAGMSFGKDFERAAGQFLTFFTFGNAPIGDNIDSVMIRGKRVYFEVADPLFLKAMLSLGPQATNWALRIGLGFKHTLTFGVTAMPSFLIPNLTRDSVSGWLLRRSNMLPVVSSIRGIMDRLQKSDAYWIYLANGGGFASQIQQETGAARRALSELYGGAGISMKNVINSPRKLVDMWIEFGSAFEYGTRLAEFKASRRQGFSAAESTFRGRDVSTDFAMRGSSDFLRYFTSTVPFLNARAQGMYKLGREVFEKDGKMQVTPGDRAWILGRRSLMLILPSLVLWWMNKDDERYKALPEWVKDLHWVLFIPGKEEPILIMKPFEMGILFASIPERIAEAIDTQDGQQLGDSLWFMLHEQLNMNVVPQIINPGYEHARNQNWMGGKVMPDDLANVDPAEQFRPWTSDTSIFLGRATGMPPILLDHYVKGYLGTMGTYVLMAGDGMISGLLPDGPEKEWADRPVIRRFTRSLPLRRTAYEDQWYELRHEVKLITNTFNKIKAEGRDPAAYLSQEGRTLLFGMRFTVDSISRQATRINGAIRQNRLDPTKSVDEKTRDRRTLLRERNQLFRDVADALSPAVVRKLRKRLEEER